MTYNRDLYCTRCQRSVEDNDADIRFKQGIIIACTTCTEEGEQLQERVKSLDELERVCEYLDDAYRALKKANDDAGFDFENSGYLVFSDYAKLIKTAEVNLHFVNSHLKTFKKREGFK